MVEDSKGKEHFFVAKSDIEKSVEKIEKQNSKIASLKKKLSEKDSKKRNVSISSIDVPPPKKEPQPSPSNPLISHDEPIFKRLKLLLP